MYILLSIYCRLGGKSHVHFPMENVPLEKSSRRSRRFFVGKAETLICVEKAETSVLNFFVFIKKDKFDKCIIEETIPENIHK